MTNGSISSSIKLFGASGAFSRQKMLIFLTPGIRICLRGLQRAGITFPAAPETFGSARVFLDYTGQSELEKNIL